MKPSIKTITLRKTLMLGAINRYQDNDPQAVDTSGLVSS